ncbi:MAG: hypothetical protein K5894_09505 [Lachnospiraceae bacterium]|nr:hypothetical protein [Lachnospiraceae bacterium]
MGKAQKKLNYCTAENWICCKKKGLLQVGDSIRLDLDDTRSAFLIFPIIDSGRNGYFWERIVIGGTFPDDSAVTIYALAWDGEGSSEELENIDISETNEKIRMRLYNLAGSPIARSTDSLLGLEGRRLFLAVELSAGGREAPEISEIAITVDGDHMIDYLPAVYRKDEFTRRFLSIFNSMFLDIEDKIERIPELFDLDTDKSEIIRMLSNWLAISGTYYSDSQLKEWIKTAFLDHENLFTKDGIKRTIKRITGKDAIIIEHFEVNPHSGECADPEMYERLYGDDPFTFFVLLPENTFKSREEKETFINNMNDMVPAGRRMELIILKQGIQLDWHSYLGVNSMVGDYTTVKIDENITLQFDTVIGGDDSNG